MQAFGKIIPGKKMSRTKRTQGMIKGLLSARHSGCLDTVIPIDSNLRLEFYSNYNFAKLKRNVSST